MADTRLAVLNGSLCHEIRRRHGWLICCVTPAPDLTPGIYINATGRADIPTV